MKRTLSLLALLNCVHNYDPTLLEHSKRVAIFATAIAREMQLPEQEIETIRYASLLHDVGKIVLPETVFKSSSGMTPEKFKIIQMHPGKTLTILRAMHFNHAEIAAAHHERLDGSGYPNHTKAVPKATRIISVADYFEATTAKRSYHEPIPYWTALEMLEYEKGMDPKVVETLRKVISC